MNHREIAIKSREIINTYSGTHNFNRLRERELKHAPYGCGRLYFYKILLKIVNIIKLKQWN